MTEERTIEFLTVQLEHSAEREKCLHEQIGNLSRQNDHLSAQNDHLSAQNDHLSAQLTRLTEQMGEQTKTIESLRDALLEKDRDVSNLRGRNRGLSKLLSNGSEKVTPQETEAVKMPVEAEKQKPSAKERGNNGAKRNKHIKMEEQVTDIWPTDPGFDKSKAVELRVVESVRYEYLPSRVIKRIIRQHNCLMGGKIYSVSAPRTPLMNSSYDASFIAGLLQFKYTYSLPVERIVKLFVEGGFDLDKGTAHSLIGKSADLLSPLEGVLRRAIQDTPYIRMDETYHRIINESKNEKGIASRKGYLWSAMADTPGLVHFFYENGSRGKDVFSGYLDKSYRGAVHTDGLACYKEIETETFPNAIRISCAQHVKRKFLDIENDGQANEIVDLINKLYRIEHAILPEWSNEKKLAYRNQHAPPVLKVLKEKAMLIKKDPTVPPSAPLAAAAAYLLNEFDALTNYLLDASYKLDNNHIEIANRYISLNRKNSLFFASHDGAKRSALLFSLACSCRLHHINTYEYFTDILSRMAYLPPNSTDEVLRELLPDKWKKKTATVSSDSSA